MVLTLDGVSVAYDGVPAVSGVSLEIAAGETVALLGPSGSGKSSLLRAIAGLQQVSGRIAWDGGDLAGVAVHRRGFGLLFQDGQLFTHRDVARNVAYGLESAGAPRAERRARVADALALVDLAGFERRDVATLSGGQRQRVALARALAPRPRLLLLDEPLSALDRSLRERLAGDIRDVLRATGTTAVYVTHDQDEAFAVADRVGVLLPGEAGGILARLAAPTELWRDPRRRDVAEFLGYQAFLTVDGAVLAVDRDAVRVGSGEAGLTSGRVAGARLRAGRLELSVEPEPVAGLELAAGVERLAVLPAPGEQPPVAGERVELTIDPSGCVPLAPA